MENYEPSSTSEHVKLTVNGNIRLQIKLERVVAPSFWSCALNLQTFRGRGVKTKLLSLQQNKCRSLLTPHYKVICRNEYSTDNSKAGEFIFP